MLPIPTGLSLASLYAENEDEDDLDTFITPRPEALEIAPVRWAIPDYSKITIHEMRDELMLGRAWNEVTAYISPKNIDINLSKPATSSQNMALLALIKSSHDVPSILVSDFLFEVTRSFNWIEADIRRCGQQMEAATLSKNPEARIIEIMNMLFDKLYRWEKEWGNGMRWIDTHFKPPLNSYKQYAYSQFQPHFLALLHHALPSPTFHTHLRTYFRSSLPALRPPRSSWKSEFKLPNRFLFKIGILPRYSSVLSDLAYEQLQKVVRKEWKDIPPPAKLKAPGKDGILRGDEDDMDEEEEIMNSRKEGASLHQPRTVLDDLRKVVKRDVLSWLFGFLEAGGQDDKHRRANISTRMEHKLQSDLYDYRCQGMFEMIIDYPDSLGGLQDMQECRALARTTRRMRLAPMLNKAIGERLLHPGVETQDVIRAYVLTIKSLKVVDDSGVLLHSIAQPIRSYLKSRPDTVSTIVSMLVESEELVEENEEVREIQVRHDAAEDWSDPLWEPEPIDAAPEFRTKRDSDILSTLVGMYDSRDVVVTELQMWLARRLLQVKEYEFQEDFAKVETLKKRFGDTTLQVCEIMIKDVKDSKRVNGQVQKKQEIPVKPIILSHHYWPSVHSTSLKLPKKIKRMQDKYMKAFHKVKQDKHIRFFSSLGSISLTLEFEDRTLDLEVTPLQATVLDAFQKRDVYTWQEMSRRIGVEDEKTVQHALNFWINERVIRRREDGSYTSLDGKKESPDETPILLETGEAFELESPGQTRADMEKHSWTEIQRLLGSGASFNTFILHRLLSRDPNYKDTKESLERFLGEMARSGLVESIASGWRLV